MPSPFVSPAYAQWVTLIDGLAEQANDDLQRAVSLSNHGPDDATIGAALVAIASQLAYGNAVAAASFNMANRLIVQPGGAGGAS